jgi:hypothetical protein
MRPRGVIRLTGGMTTDPHRRHSPRTSNWFWALFFGGTIVLVALALLPFLATIVVVALWGMGGSGSNK